MKNSRNKIAVVTGAAGFVGSHLVERLLQDGWTVRGCCRPSPRVATNLGQLAGHDRWLLDERDLLEVAADEQLFHEATVIFHLASFTDQILSKERPEEVINNNLQGMTRVLEAARLSGCKVVFASSAAVYGRADWPTSEEQPCAPLDPYGLSKQLCEDLLFFWGKHFQLEVLALRIFNGYGPRNSSAGVFGHFMTQLRAGKPLCITGDGSARRDFIFVDDIVEALLAGALSDLSGEAFNVGSGTLRTVKELAELLGAPIEYGPPRSGEPPVYCADIGKIKRDLNWSPKVSLEDGVVRSLAALKKSFND